MIDIRLLAFEQTSCDSASTWLIVRRCRNVSLLKSSSRRLRFVREILLQKRVSRGAAIDSGVGVCGDDLAHQADVDRKSVVWGKNVSVRVDIGGRRDINKN